MDKKIGHPSWYLNLGWKGLLPFIFITLLALFSLQFLEKKNSLSSDYPENHKQLEKISQNKSYFRSTDEFVLLMLQPDRDNFINSLKHLKAISLELVHLPEVASVLTPLDLMDLYDDGFSWDFIPLAGKAFQSEEEVDSFYRKLDDIGLYRKLFVGKNRNLMFYAFPAEGVGSADFGFAVKQWADNQEEGLTVSGGPLLKFYYKDMVDKGVIILPLLAFIMILLIEFLLYRRVKISLMLFLASLVPMIWALSLFPVFKLPMTLDNLIAPILVLGLASSYGIHLIRGRKVYESLEFHGVLEHISGKITIAALTTLLGFTSLLLSPTHSIVQFGVITILGILFALVFSLYALPYLLSNTPMPTDHGQLMMNRLPRPSGKRKNALFVLLIMAFMLTGIADIYMDSRILSLLPANHPYHESNDTLVDGFGGVSELEIVLDSGSEFAAVSLEYYNTLETLLNDIEKIRGVSATISYIDFTRWMHHRIQPVEGYSPSDSPDEYFIGESLEILSDHSMEGIQLSSLISPSYRYVKVLIRYSSERGRDSWNIYQELQSDINSLVTAADLGDFSISGAAVVQYYLIESHKNTIFRGLLFFFPILFLICLLYTRSVLWTLCIISSPFLSALIYFGTMGLLDIPLSIPPLISITCILGVSVDDNVFYSLSMMTKLKKGILFKDALRETYNETGGAIMDTSLAIVFVMFSFFFSNNLAIRQSGLLIIISQTVVTLYTLWFLPSFYPRSFKESFR